MVVPIILKDKYTAPIFAAALVVLVAAFSVAHINLWGSESLLIIHTDIFKGADFFGDYTDVFGIIGIAGLIWLINLALSQALYYRERILSYILAAATFIFMVLILVGVNVIISIN